MNKNIELLESAIESIRKRNRKDIISKYNFTNCEKCMSFIFSRKSLCMECFNSECNNNVCHAAGILITTIICGKKFVLMGRCSKNKQIGRRGLIEFFGGVTNPGETPIDTAIRETKEETLGVLNINRENIKKLKSIQNADGSGYILFEYSITQDEAYSAISLFYETVIKEDPKTLEVDRLMLVAYDLLGKTKNSKTSNFANYALFAGQ